MEEIEAKVLEIDVEQIQAHILSQGGHPDLDDIFEAWFFDRSNMEITNRGDLLRLRREGHSVVVAYKQKISTDGAKVMKETETQVADAENMIGILKSLGLEPIKTTKKRRIQYQWEDCHLVIDDYQGELAAIPPFLEIEAPSRERLADALNMLKIDPKEALPWSTYDLVKHYGLDTKAS